MCLKIAVFAAVIIKCSALLEYIPDEEYDVGYPGKNSTLKKKIYTADVDGISLELHEPIIAINNCEFSDPVFELDPSTSNDVSAAEARQSPKNCTLFFSKIFIKKEDVNQGPFRGFITIRALNKNGNLDISSIILLPIPDTKNLKEVFEVDGTEYIVVNYFHLKIIFFSIFITALLIAAMEIKSVYDKVKRNRYKRLEV